jgi:hypothetical protein
VGGRAELSKKMDAHAMSVGHTVLGTGINPGLSVTRG